ncbi:SAF domain protein [Rubripirellula lacrimiformis]|uniref:SAF domain protein n=1 Tax=Rubripirellula lacrimiformis TaxID=1930273 RepID=A0A517NIN8_9BACT|nr:Flp pilus assembly protein CpaB [Rubripirellula lacrimiformis]QDT07001.1 SAF domain protein [Rubripirellula lacrimiformis]
MRKSLYLLIALVCGTVATVLANQWLKAQASSAGGGSMTEIFVATAAIDIGEAITAERVRLEQWPSDRIPQGSSGDFEVLKGKYAKQRFYVGEAIMPVKLMDENWTTVPKGYRVVALKATDVSIANLIQPGDRVDVLAYFTKSDLIPQSMSKTVLMGVRVYALDGDTERRAGEDKNKNLRNIQLLIHEKDTDAWQYAQELGNVRLSLGSDADYSTEDGSNQAGKEFLAWLEDHRAAQEQAELLKERERRAMEASRNTRPEAVAVKKRDENGFAMFKMSEGRMIEYWIVPGKLPVRVGEVGDTTETETVLDAVDPVDADATAEEDSSAYLTGQDSPFYQPPSGPSTTTN